MLKPFFNCVVPPIIYSKITFFKVNHFLFIEHIKKTKLDKYVTL